jgi:hypothetical protein
VNLPAGANGSAMFTADLNSPLPDGTVRESVATVTADDGLPDSEPPRSW